MNHCKIIEKEYKNNASKQKIFNVLLIKEMNLKHGSVQTPISQIGYQLLCRLGKALHNF